MTALILAAGQGKRLYPYTAELPKNLLPLNEKPILNHQLQQLVDIGVQKIAMVIGYQGSRIREWVAKEFPHLNVLYIENPHHETSNNLYSLALATDTIENGPVLHINGDTIIARGVLAGLLARSADSSLSVTRRAECGEEEMKVATDMSGRILQMSKNLTENVRGEAIGIHFFSTPAWRHLRMLLRALRETHAEEYYEYAIEQMIPECPVYAHDIGSNDAMEVDFPEDLERAQREFGSRV